MFYGIGFSLEPAREVEIFLAFAFQPSESMLNISTIRSFQEVTAIGLYAKKKKKKKNTVDARLVFALFCVM